MKEYRIISAYDSETTNIDENGTHIAFPILHQIGILNTTIEQINSTNVEQNTTMHIFRHTYELYSFLDDLVETNFDYVPVILCHNLAFDMYGLSNWLMRHNVRVLAKSARKPITFTIQDELNQPRLVIWDTLIFTQQSLERMGKDCGYYKGVGEWNYNLIRTPETPLTPLELDYAKRDIYTLLAWFGWWLKRNTDIEPNKLGLNVVTKTGIVRERRRVRFGNLKGNYLKKNVNHYWLFRCRLEQAKSDDELFTMLAATRGGFTFCASTAASIPYDLENTEYCVSAYDATSQHPAQLVSHYYPYGFKEANEQILELAFELIGKISLDTILSKWYKPFPVAFYACFEFTNIRPRKDSLFAKYGVFPLASARYRSFEQYKMDEDNGDKAAYMEYMHRREYCDYAQNAKCAFGKLISADIARLYITELTAWEIYQAYEWDSVKAIHGYETGKFTKPNDIDTISVMQFYKAKNEFKQARKDYYSGKPITNGEQLRKLGIAPAIVDEMEQRTIAEQDIEASYLSLKADLNAIFGISASNQYRRNTVLGVTGIEYEGEFGICNKPKNPKVWYQFGQRIVGWSRIAQIVAMYLLEPYTKQILNGDTDSIKIVCKKADLDKAQKALNKLGRAIDKGKKTTCQRIKYAYPEMFDELKEIGYYINEFVTDRFCASWNKAYCEQEKDAQGIRHFNFTLAGIPTKKRVSGNNVFKGINGLADELYQDGYSYAEICNLFLGYNVSFAYDIIKLNGRKFPEWGDIVTKRITDYTGKTSNVAETSALALYPMSKTINDTASTENAINMIYALKNNKDVNTTRKLIFANGVLDLDGD